MFRFLNDIQLFITYAHEDELYLNRLIEHLKLYQRTGAIKSWNDRRIKPGKKWADEIDKRLKSTDIIIALMSSSFFFSDYCYEEEFKIALDQHKNGFSRLIPIIVRPVLWADSPIGQLQALPTDAKPVNTWSNADAAWINVIQGILKVVDDIREQKRAFVNTFPKELTSYYEKRYEFLKRTNSKVTRNIERLKRTNPAIRRKIIDFHQKAVDYVEELEKALYLLYRTEYCGDDQLSKLIRIAILFEKSQKLFSLIEEEVNILADLDESDLKSPLFGIQEFLQIRQEAADAAQLMIEFNSPEMIKEIESINWDDETVKNILQEDFEDV